MMQRYNIFFNYLSYFPHILLTIKKARVSLSDIFTKRENQEKCPKTPQYGGFEFTLGKPGVYPTETPGLP